MTASIETLRSAYQAFYDIPMKTRDMFDAIDAVCHALTTKRGISQSAYLFYGVYRNHAWTNDQTLALQALARDLGLE